MTNPTTPKTWKEFKIYVQERKKTSKEDRLYENLGIEGLQPDEDDEASYKLVRTKFALEDVTDYYESFNTIINDHGVFVQLFSGGSYFIICKYDTFVKMRIEAGIEPDPHKGERPVPKD
jgi:hypothetical protein